MHTRSWHQRIKSLFVHVAYACVVLVSLEGCRGFHRGAVAPDPSETGIETVTSNLGGIPNIGNTCYVNVALQIIAKLYPNIFDGKHESLARAGQIIVKKIKDDQDQVTREEADAFYTALLEEAPQFVRGRQEDAGECIGILFDLYNIAPPCSLCRRITDPTGSDVYSDWREAKDRIHLPTRGDDCTMQTCLGSKFDNGNLIEGDKCSYNGTEVDAQIEYKLQIDNKSQGPFSIFLDRAVCGKSDGSTKKKKHNITGSFQLTIPKAIQYNGIEDLKYTLIGFVHHSGESTNSGHYVAYIYQKGQWKLYSDARVEKVSPAQAEKAAEEDALLYFYRKVS